MIAAPLSAFAQAPVAAPAPAPQENQADPADESSGVEWTTRSAEEEKAAQKNYLGAQPPFVMTAEQIGLLGKIDGYLNSLIDVQGRFIQTDHRNERTRGRFYLHRPGKLRFDYSSPSLLRIVSDGHYLSIEDHDLKTVDKFPLDSTPIQLLLGEDVNLRRDAVILNMRQDETAVVVVIKDKSGNAPGHLQLYFRQPELELYEWVITDAQGLDTRIQLTNMVAGVEKSEEFFQASAIELEKLDNN